MCCEFRYDFRIKTMFGSSLPSVACKRGGGGGGGALLFFVSFRIFFSDNTRVRAFIFIVAQCAHFFLSRF